MAEVVLPALSTICTYQGQSNRPDRVASYLAKIRGATLMSAAGLFGHVTISDLNP